MRRSRDHRWPEFAWLRELRASILIVTDAASLVLGGVLAYLSWALPVHRQELALYARLWPVLPLFLLGYAQAGLYPGTGLGPVETLRRLSRVTLLTFLLLTGLSFALQVPYLFSRVTFTIAILLVLVLVPLSRLLVLSLVSRTRWWPEPVVIATDAKSSAGRVARALVDSPQLGYATRGVLWLGSADPESPPGDLPSWLDPERAAIDSGAAVALLATATGPSEQDLDRLQQRFHRVLVVRDFDDFPVEGIRAYNLGGFLGLEYTNNLLDSRNQAVKRAMDLLLGFLMLLASLPLLIVSILLIELRSPGPPLYFQEREGRGGRRVRVPKVRTMVPGAEVRLEEALARDPALRAEWKLRMKLREDPRLVPVFGKLLRRFSLDELPQLWSVLVGDMSLVGPRPFPDYHLEHFPERFRELRRRVRPGISGLWQVTVRSEGSLERQQSLDAYYIRNWSLWLDLYILARTAGAVLTGKGAY